MLIAVTAASGCMGPTVRTDFDPAADFTTFRTYAFSGMTGVNQGGVLDNSLVSKRLEQMVGQQLASKGLREVDQVDNPDLLVYYWVGLKEKQQLQGTGPTVGAYERRGGYGLGVGYSGVSTYEYTEGTLIVDLITAARKDLVWRASMVGTLKDSKVENLQIANEATTKAFESYPPKRTSA